MDTNFSSDRVIVKLKPGANSNEISNLQAQIGVTKVSTASQLGIDIWQIPSGTVEKIISTYKNDPRFEYIEPDYIITLEDVEKPSSATESSEKITPQATTPNDPGYSQLWGLNNIGQSGGTADADIDAPEAWDIQKGNQNLVIGVIDTGVDYDHPDLSANIWTNPGEIAGDGIDNDSNGYIDDVRGWDFAYNDNNPMDVHGHGTHVAGTIAGKGNNGVGVTGVAWNAKIMPLKFLNDSGSGSTSNAILAINYATAKGVKLTNNSWGGGGYSQALYDAINTAGQQGALFIAAAGNSSQNTDTTPAYPASYDLANIISVASTTRTDGLSWFSNYGATTVDLGAPGSDIYSAWPNSTYNTISGTSMASPHVTGAAALLWSQNPTWTAQQVKNSLMSTGDSISALNGKTVSGKRLNINNALSNLPSVINGTAGADNLTGTANADVINGLAGNDTLNGLAGNDTLDGGTENDRLDGGLGNDQLKGGLGNDIYIVDSTGDVVTELAAQGTDLVQSSVTYTLPANVENLTLTGTTAINGTGNTLANIITGNTANNILNGSSGADQLKGGTGNDTYVVDNTGDVVTELASQGTDLIQSSVTYTLPANVENLTLTGTTAINGTGNTLANIITGNTANNILNGSSGADQLKGGTGNDTYVVDNTGDVVTELASQGTDLIQSSVTYTLPANVENLTLTGTTAINGTGNTLANTVTGNTANNILNGGTGNDNLIGGSGTDQLLGSDGNDSLSGDAGNDTLTGGLGADKFIYNTNAAFTTTAVGVDTITDFNISQTDQIVLDKTTFTSISSAAGTGFSVASEFAKVTSDALAATSAADIVYNTTTGGLFYNQNGTAAGLGTGAQFLTLTNKPALTATQFLIQA